jgi:DNA-binding response OmpR family regulator
MTTVMVVDDEPIVREVVVSYLERDGYDVLQAGDGIEARKMLGQSTPDLVVLDLMLPGIDGLALCRWIRSQHDVPVIMLTAKTEEADRIIGLELGADDYVTKPFSPRELMVRIKTVLRRVNPTIAPRETIVAGDLVIDANSRMVFRAGEPVKLTAREFDLLWFLASHPRQAFSRDQLMDRVWGYEAAYDTGTVTVHIRRLREKLEAAPATPRHLETVWGIGYRFSL